MNTLTIKLPADLDAELQLASQRNKVSKSELAARHDTSVTALVRTALEHQVALDAAATSGGASGVLQELIDYSIGRRPRAVTMAAIGIDDYGALLRLLSAANPPHPLVPVAKRQAMAASMAQAVRANEEGP